MVIKTVIPAFRCASDDNSAKPTPNGSYGRSNYVVSWGPGRLIIPGGTQDFPAVSDGAFQANIPRPMSDFKDGTSSTAMASEVIAGGDQPAVGHASGDLRGTWAISHMGSFAYSHSRTPNSSDGDCLYQKSSYQTCVDVPPDMPCDFSRGTDPTRNVASARSRHAGGVNLVYVDGHVEFINNAIDANIWKAIGGINDGVTVAY